MESNTRGLELVCKHFKAEFAEQEMTSLRKRLQRSYSKTSRLNKKVVALSAQLAYEREQRAKMMIILLKALAQLDNVLDKLCTRSLEE